MGRRVLPVLVVLGGAGEAAADAAPPNMRGVDYEFKLVNQDAFPTYVFLIYPTSNNGYAYVVEKDKGLANLMMRVGSKTGPTALYALKKAEFDTWQPAPHRYNHGDNDAMVSVVPQPPASALKASKTIEPPGLVRDSSPIQAIRRSFQIVKLTDTTFELALVEERTTFVDKKVKVQNFVVPGAK
jgi:hypothetical protein